MEVGVAVDLPLGVDEDVVGAGHGEGHAEWVGLGQIIQQLGQTLESLTICC